MSASNETVDVGKIVIGFTEPTSIMEMFVLPLYGVYTALFGLYIVAAEGIYVAANFIADALLVYRCYAMWSSRTYVISGLIIISLVNTVLTKDNIGNLLTTKGDSISIQVADTIISYAFLFKFDLGVFIKLEEFGGWAALFNDLNTMVAIILESGLLYPIALIICLVLSVYEGTVETFSLLTLIVGIAATLIIVRTDLKISIENAYCPGVTESLADEEEIPYDLVAIHTRPQPYMLHKENHFKPVKMGQHI
ncbi:hypothetical protein F5877DRAFT_71334 [Lentinula edodes]|nr:hypothetical protein F5877DRAFT_71334 [Lentinula edodes]